MDPIRDFFDLGTDIMETVTKAVEKNDFTGLADALKRQVGGFKDNYRYDEDLRKAKANYEISSISGRPPAAARRAIPEPVPGRRAMRGRMPGSSITPTSKRASRHIRRKKHASRIPTGRTFT